jgi:type II secretory pathway pseudopilin PulG
MIRNGYFLIEAMIAVLIAGIVASVFTMMNYYTKMQSDVLKQQNTRTILEVVRSRLLKLAEDPDTDSYFELPKDENNTLPLTIGPGLDAWAKRIHYYTVDLGDTNTDDSFADTNTSISPNNNILGRLISTGDDMKLDTNATHSVAQNDDIMLEIGIGEVNHFKVYESSEVNTQTRAYNSAIISDTAPTSPINGTLWYDSNATDNKLKMWDSNTSTWIILVV